MHFLVSCALSSLTPLLPYSSYSPFPCISPHSHPLSPLYSVAPPLKRVQTRTSPRCRHSTRVSLSQVCSNASILTADTHYSTNLRSSSPLRSPTTPVGKYQSYYFALLSFPSLIDVTTQPFFHISHTTTPIGAACAPPLSPRLPLLPLVHASNYTTPSHTHTPPA